MVFRPVLCRVRFCSLMIFITSHCRSHLLPVAFSWHSFVPGWYRADGRHSKSGSMPTESEPAAAAQQPPS